MTSKTKAKKKYKKPQIKSEKILEAGLMPTCTGGGAKSPGDAGCTVLIT